MGYHGGMSTSRPTLNIHVQSVLHNNRSVTVMRLSGTVASDTAADARRALAPVIEDSGDSLVLDLQAVETIDSTGLMLLTDAFARLSKEQRRLVLSTTPDAIVRLLRITGLLKVFTLRPTLDESLTTATG